MCSFFFHPAVFHSPNPDRGGAGVNGAAAPAGPPPGRDAGLPPHSGPPRRVHLRPAAVHGHPAEPHPAPRLRRAEPRPVHPLLRRCLGQLGRPVAIAVCRVKCTSWICLLCYAVNCYVCQMHLSNTCCVCMYVSNYAVCISCMCAVFSVNFTLCFHAFIWLLGNSIFHLGCGHASMFSAKIGNR